MDINIDIVLSGGLCQSVVTEHMLYGNLRWRRCYEVGEIRFKFESEGLRSSALLTLSNIK